MERKTKEKKRKSNKKASISQNMFKRAATAENCRFSRFKKTSLMESAFLNYIA